MLVRKQVMMTHWLDEHIKKMAEEYDISYSEVIRLASSLALSLLACEIHPECKKHVSLDIKSIGKALKKFRDEGSLNEFHELCSQGYFEARKALECRQGLSEKKPKKKKK